MWHVRTSWLTIGVWACCWASVQAGWEIKPLASGLHGPRGVTVQPDTQHVFWIDSGGGRILRLVDGQVREAVVGMPTEADATISHPVGLLFLDPQTLMVACVGTDASQRGLYTIHVPAPDAAAVQWNQVDRLQPAWEGNNAPPAGWPQLVSARGQHILALADDPASSDGGYIARVEIKNLATLNADALGPVQRWIPKRGVQCLAISPRGEAVVGANEMATATPSAASDAVRPEAAGRWQLTMFRVTDQRPLLELPLPLKQLSGLVYSTVSSSADAPLLFAIGQGSGENATADASDIGGLYRLDANLLGGIQSLAVTPMVALERPTAVTRGTDQTLLVTVLGAPDSQGQYRDGQLVEILFVP